jgi:hypothetical protein
MMNMDMQKARREEMRWNILRALYAAQPIGTSEAIIKTALIEIVPDVTILDIRREMDYLAERQLIEIEKNRPVWFAKINYHGIDFVEYTVDCRPGIARPEKW